MRQSSELLLTFLLNATWQILLITAAASLASWLLRDSPARHRHIVWTSALVLAFFIPVIGVSREAVRAISIFDNKPPTGFVTDVSLDPVLPAELTAPDETVTNPSFQLNRWIAILLVIGYLSLICFRVWRFLEAWRFAIHLRRGATEIPDDERVRVVINRCESALELKRNVTVLSSTSLHMPVTVGLRRPVIILPEQLLVEENIELLTSAIGHEYIHVARRDYVFNLIYEFLYLPLSFHPAAALIRRGIKQTRELCCDELVAQRIINPEVYARSLVKLAGCAPTLRRLSVTTTVGIADADILEARIMSLLKKPRTDARWKRIALMSISLLLLVPCIGAAAFAMRFEMQPTGEMLVQEPLQERELGEKLKIKEEAEVKVQIDSLKRRLEIVAQEPASQEKEKVKQELEKEKIKRKIEQLQGQLSADEDGERAYAIYSDLAVTKRRREEEMLNKIVMQSTLVRLARIQMDQAIQIATSAHPGKVLACTLDVEGWEEPGKLSPDGQVFYRVVVVSGDESNQVNTHVLVNAVDGTIIGAKKELPRKLRRTEPN